MGMSGLELLHHQSLRIIAQAATAQTAAAQTATDPGPNIYLPARRRVIADVKTAWVRKAPYKIQ